ncbi:MAG: class I SAM-dependent methyltransferase [Chloroflexi bacterium]|nr:class I SAM-dependent methyltransferase [Chloroflexota bacterium]
MNYDWRHAGNDEALQAGWFEAQDRAFLSAAAFYAMDERPFDRFIRFPELKDKDVLEIGTGAGLHAQLLAEAGARVTGIDLTPAAVARTQRRFQLRELPGRFLEWDAEADRPEFAEAFDFVWSWGVIHHSARTARVVRNVHHWLRPSGAFAGMVYHRDSVNAAALVARDWVLKRGALAHSVDEALWRGTDGYMARFYPADQWRDLLLGFFEHATVAVTGQKSDVLPLPRPLRRVFLSMIPDDLAHRVVARVGSCLTFEARPANY